MVLFRESLTEQRSQFGQQVNSHGFQSVRPLSVKIGSRLGLGTGFHKFTDKVPFFTDKGLTLVYLKLLL